jgi:hypothetical protein
MHPHTLRTGRHTLGYSDSGSLNKPKVAQRDSVRGCKHFYEAYLVFQAEMGDFEEIVLKKLKNLLISQV